jgi:AAA15 family ATPase/GTPase
MSEFHRIGQAMINSLEIKNFRGYKSTKLRGLKRINIIVGRNASGKTALLESLYLTLGASPELAIKLRAWRGLGERLSVGGQKATHDALWKDLFYQFDRNRTIYISFKGSEDVTRTLKISFNAESTFVIPVGERPTDIPEIYPITFEWRKGPDVLGRSRPVLTAEGLRIKGTAFPIAGAFYSNATPINAMETAQHFSDLSKRNKQQPIVNAIREMFPFIENLSVETEAGLGMVYAYAPTLPQKVPIGLISSGINRLLAYLLAIASQSEGVVLIDEIENGFYYDTMPIIWSQLLKFCEEYETQLFASTHSREALKYLLPAMEGNEDKFSLLRTEKENGQCIVRQISGKDLEAALEEGVEVR